MGLLITKGRLPRSVIQVVSILLATSLSSLQNRISNSSTSSYGMALRLANRRKIKKKNREILRMAEVKIRAGEKPSRTAVYPAPS